MKYRYSRFVADLVDEIDMESLVSKLSDLLLSSGFNNPWDPQSEDDRTMQALHDAILDALLNGGALSEEMLNQLIGDATDPAASEGHRQRQRDQLEALVQKIIERLTEQGYVSVGGAPGAQRLDGPGGNADGSVRFEVTDKALDFLGYRALRDLLGAMGRSSVGRHDTRELATGVEAGGPPRAYEFGDTLNLDAAATVLSAIRRRATRPPDPAGSATGSGLDVEYEDLMITQGDYQSSCATVILLDCSHSMVLYGEDRFTPAKRVALALSNLIRHQYPGDALDVVLFHDSAEQVPLSQLGRVRVGPYYTNTREGLRLARRILDRQRKDMRQIIMITDGKPSAVTRPDGRIYRNAFGLDPFVLGETFAEVAACRRAGILINTFMLARDYDLVAFVRRVARICRGQGVLHDAVHARPVRAAGLPDQQDADGSLSAGLDLEPWGTSFEAGDLKWRCAILGATLVQDPGGDLTSLLKACVAIEAVVNAAVPPRGAGLLGQAMHLLGGLRKDSRDDPFSRAGERRVTGRVRRMRGQPQRLADRAVAHRWARNEIVKLGVPARDARVHHGHVEQGDGSRCTCFGISGGRREVESDLVPHSRNRDPAHAQVPVLRDGELLARSTDPSSREFPRARPRTPGNRRQAAQVHGIDHPIASPTA